jgi:hypothetical protein
VTQAAKGWEHCEKDQTSQLHVVQSRNSQREDLLGPLLVRNRVGSIGGSLCTPSPSACSPIPAMVNRVYTVIDSSTPSPFRDERGTSRWTMQTGNALERHGAGSSDAAVRGGTLGYERGLTIIAIHHQLAQAELGKEKKGTRFELGISNCVVVIGPARKLGIRGCRLHVSENNTRQWEYR